MSAENEIRMWKVYDMKKKLLLTGILSLFLLTVMLLATQLLGKDVDEVGSDFHNELFGENVYIFSPEDDPARVQAVLEAIYEKQETNQFGTERYAIYFMPGEYDESIAVDVGFYMQVAGLGFSPEDTTIESLQCLARWLSDDESNHNACCNFWRSVENITIDSNTVWAVSQATDMRRVNINGALYLHDENGWCSGGFLSDSYVELMIDSGSQQQWLSRNNEYTLWMGENWNMVFVGDGDSAPTSTWPAKAYTTIEATPIVREKPFLFYDEEKGFCVFAPSLKTNSSQTTWKDGKQEGWLIGIDEFYIAKPVDFSVAEVNAALAEGKHVLFTPGIYEIDEPIRVVEQNTVVLGMGLATLQSVNGSCCMEVADKGGIVIAGLLFDAGDVEAENLLVVGAEGESTTSDKKLPISLSDVFFRVGGTAYIGEAKVQSCVTINSDYVVGDNFWVWRADHGDDVAWDKNTAPNGIVVNGDDVTIYALMVEHFNEYQTVWNGNGGRVYMYQSEIPYDVPSQEVWMSHDGTVNGYASFYVSDVVDDFFATGLGIYLYNRDAEVYLNSAMEVPDAEKVRVEHICTVYLTGYPGMNHIINDAGEAVMSPSERHILLYYQNGESK